MKPGMILFLLMNLVHAPVFPEIFKEKVLDSSNLIATAPQRMTKTMQEPLPGTINGKDNLDAIPDYVAYEIILRSFGSNHDKDVIALDETRIPKEKVKNDRVFATAEEADLDLNQMNGLLEVGSLFVNRISVVDKQEAEIKNANWPDPSSEAMQKLVELQHQKEVIIREVIDSLPIYLGDDGIKSLHKYIKEQVKRDITFIPVPPPRRAHEMFHSNKVSSLMRGIRPVAYHPTPMQAMGGAYVYTNTYKSGNYVVGYSSATGNPSDSFLHDYCTTTSITSPDDRYAETSSGWGTPNVSTTTYMPVLVGDILIDGFYSLFTRIEVYCSIALIGYIIHEITEEFFEPPSPQIISIESDRALIGSTVDVVIKGKNFGTNPNVKVAGNGITVSYDYKTPTEIGVSFAIANDAEVGNHAVKVKAGTLTSNSKNFFVQVPTSLRQNSISQLMDEQGGCGAFREISYTLLDQAEKAILADVTVQEVFSNYTSNPPDIPSPQPQSPQANAGELVDVIGYRIPSCPPPFTASLTQTFKVVIGQTTYNLSNSYSISMGRDAASNKFVNIQ